MPSLLFTDRNRYRYSSGNFDSNSSLDANADRFTDSNSNPNTYCYPNCDNYAETFAYSEICTGSALSPYPGTPPVAFVHEKETHCATPTWGREHANNFGVRTCPPACSRRLSE